MKLEKGKKFGSRGCAKRMKKFYENVHAQEKQANRYFSCLSKKFENFTKLRISNLKRRQSLQIFQSP